MIGFEINISKVNLNAQQLETCAKEINRIVSTINSIQKNLKSNLFISKSNMYNDLSKKGQAVADTEIKVRQLINALHQVTDAYTKTENQLCKDNQAAKPKIIGLSGSVLSGDFYRKNEKKDTELSLHGELLGFSTSGKVTTGLKWKTDDKGNRKLDSLDIIKAQGSAEAHLAQGSFKGRAGIVSADASATVGKISAKGSVGAALFSGGRFTPQAYAKAEASATVAEGSANAKLGNDSFDGHLGLKGDVLTAKAKAELQAGAITVENKDGSKHTEYGVKAEAGAEAYAAQGEVSGGINIFGIKIDASIGGKAGGAGAKASGHIGTGGVGGKVGLGLGLGLEIGINIDWSNFKIGWW